MGASLIEERLIEERRAAAPPGARGRRWLLALLLVAAAPACAAAPSGSSAPAGTATSQSAADTVPVPPRVPRRPRRPPTVYESSAPGAKLYHSPPRSATPAPDRFGVLAEWERDLLGVVAEVAKTAGVSPPVPDARLHQVALDLARSSRGMQPPPSEVVRFFANHQGVVEADPAIYTLMGPYNPRGIQERYRRSLGKVFRRAAWNRVGLGSEMKGKEITVVVTLWEQQVELSPVPRELPSEGRTPLVIRLLGAYASPHIVVTLPGGQVRELPMVAKDRVLKTELRCQSGDGRYQVEILGSGTTGPGVLGNFPVFCGVRAPSDISAYDEDVTEHIDPADAEQELMSMINQARAAAGARPLLWDNRLAAIARAHSRDMMSGNFIAHVSPSTGDALARVKRAGLNFGVLVENVGQEGGVQQAHRGFMSSPGHRANIVNPHLTRVGIGVVIKGGGEAPLLVTELFAAD